MHSEIKNIASALLATALIPTSYMMAIVGCFYLVPAIRIEGAVIIMEVSGQIFSEQQKKQLIRKITFHFLAGLFLLLTTLVFIYLIE